MPIDQQPPSTPSSDLLIEAQGLSKSFDAHVVVDGGDLAVRRREIFGLIGPNGAGKSTLIKMLTTLLPPSAGEAWIAGCDLRRMPQSVRAHIGYVPQLLSADGALTGYENLLLSARLYLIPRAERAQRIEEALRMTELLPVADRLAQHYSGGMLRRLEIAQSTLHRPALLIMDEPTVGLDPVARAAVWRHICDLRDSFGTTILVTTHVMEEVDALCDRIAILHRGILAQSVLFAAIFYGISTIWERDLGVLHRYMVSPAPRSALVLGKAVSAAIRGLSQALVIYLLAIILGIDVDLHPASLLAVAALIALGSGLFSTFSLIIACIVKTRERFMGIGQVLTMPIFFASNAIYPIEIMPTWLRAISLANPLTYEVDALRTLMLNGGASKFGLGVDCLVLILISAILIVIAARIYPRMTA